MSELRHSLELQQRDYDKSLADERNKAANLERELRLSANDAANDYASKVELQNIENKIFFTFHFLFNFKLLIPTADCSDKIIYLLFYDLFPS